MAEPTTTTAQAVEIAKTILDKLTDAAKAAQTTVEQALPHVVRAYAYRQIGITASFVILTLVGLALVYFASRIGIYDNKNDDPKIGIVPLVGGVAALVFGALGVVFTLGDTIGVLGDPMGMFILGLIGK